MNDEESRRLSEERSEERMAGLLREASPHLIPRVDPDELVEHVLARGTDRLFSCDSPLGEVYVGVSERGVRLVGRAAAPGGLPRRSPVSKSRSRRISQERRPFSSRCWR